MTCANNTTAGSAAISSYGYLANEGQPPSPGAATTIYGADGLNRMTMAGSASLGYDGRGNMTSDGAVTFGYNANNLLTTTSAGASLAYDAENRLARIARSGYATTRFLYDGVDVIAEYDDAGAVLRRYVHGPGTDEPLVWYEGSGTGDRRYYHADPQGSITQVTNGSGGSVGINRYDEYGLPAGGNVGRFQYTGQMWLPEVGLYYYKARMYAPSLGRFMQTDPIGYADGMNWYAYVGNDPVNMVDPSGLQECLTLYYSLIVYDRDTGIIDKDSSSSTPFQVCYGNTNSGPILTQWWGPVLGSKPPVTVRPPNTIRPVTPRLAPRPSVPYPKNPKVPPGKGWKWYGGEKGQWHDKKTGESLRPDLQHPLPKGPHYDYSPGKGQGGRGEGWRWYPDGRMEPKNVNVFYNSDVI